MSKPVPGPRRPYTGHPTRVLVPRERRDAEGVMHFKTQDKTEYVRDANGCIRRVKPDARHT